MHLVQDYDGDANISEPAVQMRLDSLNAIFDSICISFEVCEIRYIANYQYDNASPSNFELMQIAYNEANRINLYFSDESNANQGIATQGGINNVMDGGIVTLKSHSAGDLAHLMGHYFGLYNTFQGSQGPNPELADGSNCLVAGDSICDTPADPFYFIGLSQWLDQPLVNFIYEGLDANGDYYNPFVRNIMSNYPRRCFFTYGQYTRMANFWLNSSQEMW